MVAGESLEVLVEKFVSGRYHQRGPELKRTSAGVSLDIAPGQCPRPCDQLTGTDESHLGKGAGANDPGRLAFFIEKDFKRD